MTATTTRFPIALTRRVIDRYAAGTGPDSVDTVPTTDTERGDVFVDPIRFELEREVLFRRSPHVVAWSGELREPGAYLTRDVMGVQVLVTRADDGELRAFRNACTHRGAQVADGCGTARRLTCPYHAWSFDLLGRLVGQPEAWAFADRDPAELHLRPLPVADIEGLVVVGLDDGVDVEHALDDIRDELRWCGYADCDVVAATTYQVRANWKLAVDVNLEVYHVAYLHRESLHPLLAHHVIADTFGRHGRHAFATRAAADLVGRPEDEWPDVAPLSVVHTLFPSCVILETPVSSQMFRIYPGAAPGECVVHLAEASLHPVASEDERQHRLFGFDYTCRILQLEDFPVAEQCQRGVESGLDRLTFGRLEPMLQHWHRVWREALDA